MAEPLSTDSGTHETGSGTDRSAVTILLTAAVTGLLLAACWWGYWVLADMLRKPPFRGTLIAELHILAPIVVSFAVLSLAQLVHNRLR
jgi:hypothetical protein